MLLKKYMLTAGTLLAITLIASAPVAAAPHRAHRLIRGVVAQGAHVGRPRVYVGARAFVRRRLPLGVAQHFAGLRRGRLHIAGRYARLARHGYGRRFVASVNPTEAIRSYVGPSSAYTPVSSGGQIGGASYYSGGRTASGGSVGAATCAHRSLPFGTRVLVTNLRNARQAVLTVNDRGPFVGGRIIDVSRGAAGTLGMLGSGVARVSVKVIGGPG